MNNLHSALLIAVIAVVTVMLRAFPFLVFSGRRKVPGYIMFLGDKLPYAIIGMLIVYCLRNVSFGAVADWLPSFISVIVVVVLHIWKRKTLISVAGGTLVYMFLVQAVFV